MSKWLSRQLLVGRHLVTKRHCPDGGIGRRVGLKHRCRKAYRFDPGSGYKASPYGGAFLSRLHSTVNKFQVSFIIFDCKKLFNPIVTKRDSAYIIVNDRLFLKLLSYFI